MKNRERHLHNLFYFLVGLGLVVLIFLGSHTVVSDTWELHLHKQQVRSLMCSFERTQFETKILDVPVYWIRQINVTLGNKTLTLYMTQSDYDVKDVGFMKWKNGEILTFSPVSLLNGSRYIVQQGELFNVTTYGDNQSTCLFTKEIREVNWLDETIVDNFLLSRSVAMIILVGAFSLMLIPLLDPLLCFPLRFIKRVFRTEKEERERKSE